MDALYKMFDRITEMIPGQLLPVIRFGAIGLWAIMAIVVVIISWSQGTESAPQIGQELSIAEMKERQKREENLKDRGEVSIPGLDEILPERSERSETPFQYEYEGEREPTVMQEDDALREPSDTREPTYQGDNPAPLQEGGSYVPNRDAGVGGVRERFDTQPGEGGLLPLPGEDERARRSDQQTQTPPTRSEQSQPAREPTGSRNEPTNSDDELPMLQ